MHPESTAVDRRIAAIAARQRGTISRDQLLAIGISRRSIERWLADGRLHRIFRGVYLVGHSVPPALARETAALLAYGSGTILSHETAAVLWQMRDAPRAPDVAPIEVTLARRGPSGQAGLRVHRVADVARVDMRRLFGLPVLAPARTLVDLASRLPHDALADAFERARVRRILTPADVLRTIERNPRRRGAPKLRFLVADHPGITRSRAERELLALIRRSGLPRPTTNMRLCGHEVDALWRTERLVVEVDGWAYHSGREAFERDRRRDAELQAAGYRVIRVTWRRIIDEPEALLVTLAQALATTAADEQDRTSRS